MKIEYDNDKIKISCMDVTHAEHEIEKVYLTQFRNAQVEIVEDPRTRKVCQLVIKPVIGAMPQ